MRSNFGLPVNVFIALVIPDLTLLENHFASITSKFEAIKITDVSNETIIIPPIMLAGIYNVSENWYRTLGETAPIKYYFGSPGITLASM